MVIQASVPGSGDGASGGQVPFNALRENQRTGLLLANGVVYFGFSSHGDNAPFHGWVLGYNATTLQQVLVYNDTANGADGGIWMNGDGLATDSTGNLYFITGNGTFDANSGGKDYGDTFVKISPAGVGPGLLHTLRSERRSAAISIWGRGECYCCRIKAGAHPHEMVSTGKNGTIYLVDRDNMGRFHPDSDQIVQSLVNIFPNNLGSKAATSVHRSTSTDEFISLRSGRSTGVFVDQRVVVNGADLSDLRDLRLSRGHDGHLRQWRHERDPLDSAE